MKTILASPNLLKIENIALYSDEVRLIVKTRSLKSACPSCGRHSTKIHSRYQRHLADLPWEGIAAKLVLSVRKFFRLNPECRQRFFCERLPGLAAPHAHKTIRLNTRQHHLIREAANPVIDIPQPASLPQLESDLLKIHG